VTIYYSRFQFFKSGVIDSILFRPATSWTEIPVSLKHGDDTYFSYVRDEQLMWCGWNEGEDYELNGYFCTMRPPSGGSWWLAPRRTKRGAEVFEEGAQTT
jgi:hypothetical protein